VKVARGLGISLAALGLLAAVLSFGWAWQQVTPRDDAIEGPDAVVVLGGGPLSRVELGVAIADRTGAALVLSSSAAARAAQVDVVCLPPVECFVPEPHDTRGEARGVAELAAMHDWNRVVVVTSQFHTGRARILFRQCLGRAAVVGAIDPDPASPGLRAREAAKVLGHVTRWRAC
jgi:uncharacterized SAM-binding protein YcdF (DUF218 family)